MNNICQHYLSGYSVLETSINFKVSAYQIRKILQDNHISIRSRSEALYSKYNHLLPGYKISPNLEKDDNFLFGLGLGIYSGEGNKLSKNSVRITNTDPKIILNFRNFLYRICQINPKKLHYSLIIFNNQNPDQAKTYWSKLLQVHENKFGKIVVIPPKGKGTYKNKSFNGVCTLTYCDTKLKNWIHNEINSILPG